MMLNQPFKILWLIPSRNAPWYHELAKALAEARPDLTITLLSFVARQSTECKKSELNGVEYHSYRTDRVIVDLITLRLKRIWKIRKALSAYTDYDLLHIHGTEHQFQMAAVKFNKPTVVSIQGILTEYVHHEVWARWKQKFSWLIGAIYEKKYLKQSNDFFCRTHWDKAFIKKHHPQARIHHCWEMIRPEFFSPHADHKSKNIAFIGGLNEIKGISLMLEVFRLLRLNNAITLTIIGSSSSEELNQLLEAIGAPELVHDIELTGPLDAPGIIKVYDRSAMLVHPSKIDNSPNSICEAQLCGLPVVATNVGGVASLIEDEVSGFFSESKPKSLCGKIEELLNHEEKRLEAAENARENASKRHSAQEIVEKTFEVYHDLINR